MTVCCSACGKDTAADERTAARLAEEFRDISPELVFEKEMELTAAEQFAVNYYNGGYVQLVISDGSRFLLVPEGGEVPAALDAEVKVLQQPLDRMYLVATAAMDMFRSIDALSQIRFSGTAADGWHIREAREAMEAGDILYAGKYNAPDYERILSENCQLAVENTMLLHTPEVREKLESFGIPVLIDYSSYEVEPLGRMEWVKLYGLLTGREDAADAAFRAQEEAMSQAAEGEPSGKTAAFFYITANGTVNVRKGTDYIGKLIEMAGGTYVFSDLGEPGSRTSTVTMQMEEFFAVAREADYLIYNSTVDGPVRTLDELLGKSSMMAEFKAVQEGRVWCTEENLYQESMGLGYLAEDFHRIFRIDNVDTAEAEQMQEELTYLFRLE